MCISLAIEIDVALRALSQMHPTHHSGSFPFRGSEGWEAEPSASEIKNELGGLGGLKVESLALDEACVNSLRCWQTNNVDAKTDAIQIGQRATNTFKLAGRQE